MFARILVRLVSNSAAAAARIYHLVTPRKETPMSTPHQDAWMYLFQTGMQYYIAGRAAARGRLIPVAGNLLHHGVEMLLKGELSKTLPLEEIKKQYGHLLVKTWSTFKAMHSGQDLSGFDQLIVDLDHFEKIRYPDEYLKHGGEQEGRVGARTLLHEDLAPPHAQEPDLHRDGPCR